MSRSAVVTCAIVFAASSASGGAEADAGPWIIAHRGASADAPENTIAAFREAWAQGADGIEADFYLSRDGEVVCVHDKTTKRCGDRELNVKASTLEQLRTVDVGSWKDAKFAGERIPTLAQVLATVPEGKRIFIELKDGPAIVEPTRKAIEASGLKPTQIAIIAFDKDVIAACRRTMPSITTNWLTSYKKRNDGTLTPTGDSVLNTLKTSLASGLGSNANRAVLTEAFIARLRAAGYGVHCWTVNDAADAVHFMRLGIDSITTDRPAAIRRALKEASMAPTPKRPAA